MERDKKSKVKENTIEELNELEKESRNKEEKDKPLEEIAEKIGDKLGNKKPNKKEDKEDNPFKQVMKELKIGKTVLIVFAIVFGLGFLGLMMTPTTQAGTISWSEFVELAEQDKIEKLVIVRQAFTMTVVLNETETGEKIPTTVGMTPEEKERFEKENKLEPKTERLLVVGGDEVLAKIQAMNIPMEIVTSNTNRVVSLLQTAMWIVVMVVILRYMSKAYNFDPSKNKSKNRIIQSKTTFKDVAGLDEEKEELKYIIDTLKDPERYLQLGATPVKGVLLEGPPGVGKTLLAKAVAGEAGVNFISYSGSDFVEIFAGVGARRVREMYDEAEKLAPCVIFIDEIDALGMKRDRGINSQEADQTLNALLQRMDGVESSSQILFMGATNRVDMLDKALIRPGRFDKIIHISPPSSKKDREAIIALHLSNKKISETLDVEQIGKMLYGLTGAEISECLNDAVVMSIRTGGEGIIRKQDIDESLMKLIVKGVIKSRHGEKERERVAYHELGHAIMNEIVGRDVIKVSIQPYSSGLGGVTMVDGESLETTLQTKEHILNTVKVLYAGRVAEEIFLGSISTGAINDLDRATVELSNFINVYAMDNDNILNIQSLAQASPNIVGNEERLARINKLGLQLYEEVKQELSKPEVKERIEKLKKELLAKEVIYTLDI